jgi:two-component system, NarL family, sensor histidine kinase DegS
MMPGFRLILTIMVMLYRSAPELTIARQRQQASNGGRRCLEREIRRRQAAEAATRRGREQYDKLFSESRIMQGQLRDLTHRVISAHEEERKEISRELHDDIVQGLIGINIELSALSKEAPSKASAIRPQIARIQRMVNDSVDSLHRFARELRPAVLDDLGLIPALQAYGKRLAARKQIKVQMTAFAGVEALSGAKLLTLFRVAQESLTNVARHAQATRVSLSITKICDAIQMEISDNGKSFDVGSVLGARNPKRLGLVGMKERIEMVGGNLTISSARGKGTIVHVEIPVETGEANKWPHYRRAGYAR